MNATNPNNADEAFVAPGYRILYPGPGQAVVEIIGEHDLASRDTIQQVFLQLVAEKEVVVIDLREATFIDSSFISALIQSHKYAEERQSHLRLQLGTTPSILRVIELTQLANHIGCFHNRDDALS